MMKRESGYLQQCACFRVRHGSCACDATTRTAKPGRGDWVCDACTADRHKPTFRPPDLFVFPAVIQ